MNSALSYHVGRKGNVTTITMVNVNQEILDFMSKVKTYECSNGVIISQSAKQDIAIIRLPAALKLQVFITGFNGTVKELYDGCSYITHDEEDKRQVYNDIVLALHELKCDAYGHSKVGPESPPTVIWAE